MSEKLKVGILGGTGMVGQRFISLLENHPWFEVTTIAASPRSAGKTYAEAVGDRWKMTTPMPEAVKNLVVMNVNEVEKVAAEVDFVFSAVDMTKEEIMKIEEDYAKTETPVVSNNSAHRWTPDVPMVVPEINPDHMKVIDFQKKRLGTERGFIAVKPNCSIQSYVPMLTPLLGFGIKEVVVCTYQAISGAGKTFNEWPEMIDNIIPFIGGEEDKSENEPLKIWGKVEDGKIIPTDDVKITAQCFRVPVSDGHTAAVFVSFKDADKQLMKWYERELKKWDIDIRLNSEVKDINSLLKAYDDVIVSVGTFPKALNIKGFNKTITFTDLLIGPKKDDYKKIVFLGGGLSSCEAAYDAVLAGKKPVVVEFLDDLIVAPGTCLANSSFLREALPFKGVPVHLRSSVTEIGDGYCMIKNFETGDLTEINIEVVSNPEDFWAD